MSLFISSVNKLRATDSSTIPDNFLHAQPYGFACVMFTKVVSSDSRSSLFRHSVDNRAKLRRK